MIHYDFKLCYGIIITVFRAHIPQGITIQPAFECFCADLVKYRKLFQRARFVGYFLCHGYSLLSSFTIS